MPCKLLSSKVPVPLLIPWISVLQDSAQPVQVSRMTELCLLVDTLGDDFRCATSHMACASLTKAQESPHRALLRYGTEGIP